MRKLLIIADDFTGALDTGIQFAIYGIRTEIIMDKDFDFCADSEVNVYVVDTETRHLKEEIAYEIVYSLADKAIAAGIKHIYKKTDSGLRGNIAKEIKAVLDASKENFLAFVPAYPDMKRIVKNGVCYVDGVELENSVFGQDPFEPVKRSKIKNMFGADQELIKEYRNPEDIVIDDGKIQIAVFDAVENKEMERIAKELNRRDRLHLMAGCAGFAAVIASYLEIKNKRNIVETIEKPLLVVCGSINKISKKQLEYAQKVGYTRFTLTPEQQFSDKYLDLEQGKQFLHKIMQACIKEDICMLDTCSESSDVCWQFEKKLSLEEARVKVADRMGEILKKLIENNLKATFMIIGGDTLIHFIKEMKCNQIILLNELESGVVYAEMKNADKSIRFISKSGGFGDEDLLVRLAQINTVNHSRQTEKFV